MRIISIAVLLLIAAGNLSSTDDFLLPGQNDFDVCVSEVKLEMMQELTHRGGKIDSAFDVSCSKVEIVTNCYQNWTESLKASGQTDRLSILSRDMLNVAASFLPFLCLNRELVKDVYNSADLKCFSSKLHMLTNCCEHIQSLLQLQPYDKSSRSVINYTVEVINTIFMSSMLSVNTSAWQDFKQCSLGIFQDCEDQVFLRSVDHVLNFVENETEKITRNRLPESRYAPIISIMATTLHSITIEWVTPSTASELQVDLYLVQKLVDEQIPTNDTVIVLPATTNSYIFENLTANTTYRNRVTACGYLTHRAYICFGSRNKDAITLDREPKFIPIVLILAPTSNTSFTIGWLPPPPELQGRVMQYKVMASSALVTTGPVYLAKTATSYVFDKLEIGYLHSFKVAACSEYVTQCGNWSSKVEHWIGGNDSYPKFIPDVSVTATTSDSIKIGWSMPPPGLRDEIHAYKVMATLWDTILRLEYVAKTANSHIFTNLSSEIKYQIRVAACPDDIERCGYWSREQESSTIDRDPRFIPNVWVQATTLDSITIGCSRPPSKLRNRVHRYKLMLTQHQNESNIIEPVYLDRTVNSYVIGNLSSLTDYWFKIAACSEYVTQCANWSSEIIGRTMDRNPIFIPKVWVETTTRTSITIGWSTPSRELRDRIYQYKVMATHRYEEREPTYLNKTANSHTFENLTSEVHYRFKVAACSEYTTQCANWSTEVVGFTTDTEAEAGVVIYLSLTVAVVLLVIVGTCLIIRRHRELAVRKKFIKKTLERFNVGAVDCLNMELNVGDQAELLPYDQKWEYPRELLTFDDKVLGSGAFGIVKKAKAKSIRRNEAETIVAVKMVRSTSTLNYMTVLSRELKILAWLGKHVNVVNLLGACTENVPYGELFVIVEFCRYGNVRDYLVRHRADFDSEENLTTDIVEAGTDSGTDRGNLNSSGNETSVGDVNFATADHGDITNNTDSHVEIDACVPDTEVIALDLRSKYEGNYADLNEEPIGVENLKYWAWQVARGMKFLGSRRILHGDLAARNILLTDHNIVKICDFGLAKTLYTDENYEKKDQGPLPAKWMAIESLKDRIFSVKSDVWSYGIVLWEFFSLGETPYPEIRPRNVHQKLAEGYRMEKPKHATPVIYDIMLKCWDANPSKRPSFETLINNIYVLLDGSFTTQYLDLSATYIQLNDYPSSTGRTDYLIMGPSLDTSDTVEKIMESSV